MTVIGDGGSLPLPSLRAYSTKELIDDLIVRVGGVRERAGRGEAGREFSLAITALEDAQMRFTRGLAKEKGVFNPVDLERVEARLERARFEKQVVESPVSAPRYDPETMSHCPRDGERDCCGRVERESCLEGCPVPVPVPVDSARLVSELNASAHQEGSDREYLVGEALAKAAGEGS